MTLVHDFTYRDTPGEQFSSKYFLTVPPPSSPGEWSIIVDQLRTWEEAIYTGQIRFVQAYGYDTNDPKAHHVYAHDYTLGGSPPVGTFTPAASPPMSGDQVGMIWWLTGRLSNKGKPVYLRKFVHGGYVSASDRDKIDPTWSAAMLNFANQLSTSGALGGHITSGGYEDTIVAHGVSQWATTRTLKRRGKRPVPKA